MGWKRETPSSSSSSPVCVGICPLLPISKVSRAAGCERKEGFHPPPQEGVVVEWRRRRHHTHTPLAVPISVLLLLPLSSSLSLCKSLIFPSSLPRNPLQPAWKREREEDSKSVCRINSAPLVPGRPRPRLRSRRRRRRSICQRLPSP